MSCLRHSRTWWNNGNWNLMPNCVFTVSLKVRLILSLALKDFCLSIKYKISKLLMLRKEELAYFFSYLLALGILAGSQPLFHPQISSKINSYPHYVILFSQTPMRYNHGHMKRWKTSPNLWTIHLSHGLYVYIVQLNWKSSWTRNFVLWILYRSTVGCWFKTAYSHLWRLVALTWFLSFSAG